MTTDDEFRAAAKLNAHEKVLQQGGPIHLSVGDMVNIGVDCGIDFERLRVCSVLRLRAAAVGGKVAEELHVLAMQVQEGIQ